MTERVSAWHRQCWEQSCASPEGSTSEAMQRKLWRDWKPTITKMPQSPIPSQGHRSRCSDSKSKLLFAFWLFFFHQMGGGAPCLGKEKEGFILSSASMSFLLFLPTALRIKANSLGTLLNWQRATFKAMGRHSSPLEPRICPPCWQCFVLS